MMEWASPSASSTSEASRCLLLFRFLNLDFFRRDDSRAERGRNAEINAIAGCFIMQGILLWMSLRIPQYLTRNLYWYHGQLNLEKQHAEPIHNPYKVEVNRERHIHGYGCS